jgi:hypothetical protein
MVINGPLTNAGVQTVPIPLPQTNISKYSYHYVYIFLSPPCNPAYISNNTYGFMTGQYQLGGGITRNVPVGGLVSQEAATVAGSNSSILTMKGNGAVTSLTASITLYAGGSYSLGACTMDVLYKGTTREEEGAIPVGVYSNSKIAFTNRNWTPSVSTSGTATTYYYYVSGPYDPLLGTNTFENAVAVDSIYACVNPNDATGLYRGTTPILVQLAVQGLTPNPVPLGYYSLTNGCLNISPTNGSLAIITSGGDFDIAFTFPTATAYPTTTKELAVTVFGHNIY